MRPQTRKFLENLHERKLGGRANYYRNREAVDDSIEYLDKLSKIALNKLISDPYWNKYPSWKRAADDAPIDMKPYGIHLNRIVSQIFAKKIYLASAFSQKAEGVLLAYTMDYSVGDQRIKSAKRALKSVDLRCRKRAAKILPLNSLKKMINDPNADVRRLVFKRIGLDNCAKDFVNDDDFFIRYRAMISASLDDFDYNEVMDEFIKYNLNFEAQHGNRKRWPHWSFKIRALINIVSRMPYDNVLFRLNLLGYNKELDEILMERLESGV